MDDAESHLDPEQAERPVVAHLEEREAPVTTVVTGNRGFLLSWGVVLTSLSWRERPVLPHESGLSPSNLRSERPGVPTGYVTPISYSEAACIEASWGWWLLHPTVETLHIYSEQYRGTRCALRGRGRL